MYFNNFILFFIFSEILRGPERGPKGGPERGPEGGGGGGGVQVLFTPIEEAATYSVWKNHLPRNLD